jgi:NRAMP (natural resistance-associated macrophage protein)-like metal ion transporter
MVPPATDATPTPTPTPGTGGGGVVGVGVEAAAERKSFWKRVLLIMAVIGPGIITANVDNDAGGITTYSIAGAQYGYHLLWELIPVTLALIVVQEMAARMGAVTGKGLADLIRERFGVRITFWVMFVLLLCNLGNTFAEFSGIAAAAGLFHVPKYVSVPLAGIAVWILVVKGSYRQVEKIFLVACGLYVTYFIACFMAHPSWGHVLEASVVPSLPSDSGSLAMIIGIVGTTIAPWMQFYLQSSIVDKGVRKEDYSLTRIDVVVGCVLAVVVAFFIVVACAIAIFYAHGGGHAIETAADAARGLAPLGKSATLLFAFGLLNASVFAAAILPLSTAYYICEGFGWEGGIGKRYRDAPEFYWLYTAIIIIGGAVILIPGAPLIRIMYVSQVVNGGLLPFILVFMLLLINKRSLMGEYVNSKAMNVIGWTVSIVMSGLTLVLVGQTLIQLF